MHLQHWREPGWKVQQSLHRAYHTVPLCIRPQLGFQHGVLPWPCVAKMSEREPSSRRAGSSPDGKAAEAPRPGCPAPLARATSIPLPARGAGAARIRLLGCSLPGARPAAESGGAPEPESEPISPQGRPSGPCSEAPARAVARRQCGPIIDGEVGSGDAFRRAPHASDPPPPEGGAAAGYRGPTRGQRRAPASAPSRWGRSTGPPQPLARRPWRRCRRGWRLRPRGGSAGAAGNPERRASRQRVTVVGGAPPWLEPPRRRIRRPSARAQGPTVGRAWE